MASQKIKIVTENAQKEYTPEELQTLAREARTMSRLAIILGLHRNTISNTMQSDKIFCASVEAGFSEAVKPVIDAMYKQAEKGDVGAGKFILINRAGDDWAEKTKSEVKAEVIGISTVLDQLEDARPKA